MAWSSIATGTDLVFRGLSSAKEAVNVSLSGYMAAEAISAFRCLYLSGGEWRVAHANVIREAMACVAVSTAAASIGGVVSVVAIGELNNPSWSFGEGDTVWLSDSGTLSAVAGSNLKVIGTAMGPTKVFVDPGLFVGVF